MTAVPGAAVTAAAEVLTNVILDGHPASTGDELRDWVVAKLMLEAAEKAWPHGYIVQTQPNPRGGTIGDRP